MPKISELTNVTSLDGTEELAVTQSGETRAATSSDLGGIVAITSAEVSAGVTPSDYSFEEYEAERYGIPVDGSTDARTAIAAADALGKLIFRRGTALIGSNLTISSDIFMYGDAKLKPDTGVTLTIAGLYHAPEVGIGFDASAGTVKLNDVPVAVPSTYATIQEAVDACPRRLCQEYKINLADGTYAEDVRIDGIIAMANQPDSASALEGSRLVIRGAALTYKDPDVQVKSIRAVGCAGYTGHPTISTMTVYDANPYDNEGAAVAFYGCPNASVIGLSFDGNGVQKCILSYASVIGQSDGHDFGTSVNSYAYTVKHGGRLVVRNRSDGGSTPQSIGTLIESPYWLQAGEIIVDDYGILKGTAGMIDQNLTTGVGLLIDQERGRIITKEEPYNIHTFHYESFFDETNAWKDNGSVNGTFAEGASFRDLATGATTNDKADFQFARRGLGILSSDTKVHCLVHLDNLDLVGNGTFYFVIGDLGATYVGFKVTAAGVLQGVVEDGLGEDTVQLDAVAPANDQELSFHMYDGHVDFYRNAALKGTLTISDPLAVGTIMANAQLITLETVAKSMRMYRWKVLA